MIYTAESESFHILCLQAYHSTTQDRSYNSQNTIHPLLLSQQISQHHSEADSTLLYAFAHVHQTYIIIVVRKFKMFPGENDKNVWLDVCSSSRPA